MTIEQVKAEAKKRFGKEITDEQAGAWLKAHPDGKLTDEELDGAAGGFSSPYDPNDLSNRMFDCPKCGRRTLLIISGSSFRCNSCGYNSMGEIISTEPGERLRTNPGEVIDPDIIKKLREKMP